MDPADRNGNHKKRKFSQSVEREEQSVGCFRRCCTRRKRQTTSMKEISSIPMRSLARSPLFHETTLCQKGSEADDDPCLEYCVQYGPDSWENINQETRSNKQPNKVLCKRIKADGLPVKEELHSSINDFVGDGVNRMSEVIATKSTSQHREKELTEADHQNQLTENQTSETVVEKTSQMTENLSSQILSDGYNWNLLSNEINFDPQKASDRLNSLQDQEPYNWDFQEYQWSTENTQVIPKVINNRSKQSRMDNTEPFLSAHDLTNRSNSVASVLSSNKISEVQPPSTAVDQQKSISNLFAGKNNRLNAKSADDLVTDAKKQELLASDSSSIISHPFGVPEILIENDDPKQAHSSRNSLNEKQLLAPPNTEIEDRVRSIDTSDPIVQQIRSTYNDLSVNKSVLSHEIQYTVTFHFRMHFSRHVLERFLHFMSPVTQNAGHNIDSTGSIITSDTHSWSTMTPSLTLDMFQSVNVGPWWGRRDVYDQTPATFIFANESLSSSYSIESITGNQQMCISIENRPCDINYYSCLDTCHCCCCRPSSF